MGMGRLLEELLVEVVAVPIDTNGAVVASDWIHLKHYRRLLCIVAQGAWAGGTPALTFSQAKDNAGASSKALAYTDSFSGVALTADVMTKNTITSNTSNLPSVANSYTVVEFHAQDLDIANTFEYVQCNVASPGANADLICVIFILGDPGYAGLPSTRPSAQS